MLPQFPAAVRVFLCTRPTDMRKSFDGLLGMVHEFLGQDPPLRPPLPQPPPRPRQDPLLGARRSAHLV